MKSLILSISSCRVDHSEEVLVRGVTATLVACGENESASFGGIVDCFFACGDYVGGRAEEHNVGCVKISL